MELLKVHISLDRVRDRIVWQSTEEELPALRMAIRKGQFGPARIMSIETPQRPVRPFEKAKVVLAQLERGLGRKGPRQVRSDLLASSSS